MTRLRNRISPLTLLYQPAISTQRWTATRADVRASEYLDNLLPRRQAGPAQDMRREERFDAAT
jgi:hypothetical protein